MDPVQIILFFVVGITVVAFFVFNNLDSVEKTESSCLETEQNSLLQENKATETESPKAIDDQQPVGADDEVEKEVIFEKVNDLGFREIEEKEHGFGKESEKSDPWGEIRGITEYIKISEGESVKKDELLDDWEGIERTDLEKVFGEAVVFVSSKCNADKIDGDLLLELYGLQQIALEGPCHGSQPMALMVSARSKWNAWQKLGEMSREMAMEKYIDVLSKTVPDWQGEGVEVIKNAILKVDDQASRS